MAVVLLTLSLGAHVLMTASAHRQLWSMIDLDVYRWGGHAARTTTHLYDDKYANFLSFTYPPIAAAIFVPLADINFNALRVLVSLASIASLAVCIWVVFGALGRARADRLTLTLAVTAIAVWLEPVQQTLKFGQINILLMALVLVDLCQDDARRRKGIGVGIAAGIKLTPAIFVVYLIVTRRFRAAATAVGSFISTVIIGFALLPHESSRFWFDRLFLDADRVGGVAYVANQSLHGAFVRVAGGTAAADPWWLLAAIPVAALGLWLATRRSMAGNEIHGILLCALTGLLVSPVSWSHHWVWIAPALAVAVDYSLRCHRTRPWLLSGTIVLLSAAWIFHVVPGERLLPEGLLWFAPHEGDRELHWTLAQTVIGNVYVVGGLAVLASTALLGQIAHRRQRP